MAPGNNERHTQHTGTIPKTKVRNNCNVPQEAVTPTRRDLATNIVSTSLDWVPVSEYNPRSNYNQTRKPANNITDHDYTDLETSVSFESGFGRFVPVRPQPRILPINIQNREGVTENNEDNTSVSVAGYSLHPYPHAMTNGLIPNTSHGAAAVMIVNPTTPNIVSTNMAQQYNVSGSQNRNNLTRNYNSSRNNFDGNANSSNNNATPSSSNTRVANKSVNLMNNMYDSQGSSTSVNDNNHPGQRGSARALGDAIVAACPDAVAVERRLGQIREYIRVTSSLVDTMRNSEDEAYIEHTKEEYDELVQMVMKLKESETKLEKILVDNPDNQEVPTDDDALAIFEIDELSMQEQHIEQDTQIKPIITMVDNENTNIAEPTSDHIGNDNITIVNEEAPVKIVSNLDNEMLNKNLNDNDDCVIVEINDENYNLTKNVVEESAQYTITPECVTRENVKDVKDETFEPEPQKSDDNNIVKENELRELLKQNIISCSEKLSIIENLKCKSPELNNIDNKQDAVRPVSVQSNCSGYSETELWQNEVKNKMEISQQRLAALHQQQKRLLKYQADAKQQLDEIAKRARQSQEYQPASSHDMNQSGNFHHPNRMYAANQIGVATTLPHSGDGSHQLMVPQHVSGNVVVTNNGEHVEILGNQDERFSRDTNGEEASGMLNSDAEGEEGLSERGRELTMKLRELQLKKQHMENLRSEFKKLQMATHVGSNSAFNNTYSSSGEDSGDDEPGQKCNKSIKNGDPFKLIEINAIKTALQKTKDLMRSVDHYEVEQSSNSQEDSVQFSHHSNINDTKSEGGGSAGGWSNEGSVCRVRNSLPQRHKFTNEQHSQQQHQQQNHEANVVSLQDLAQRLQNERDKIRDERSRLKDAISKKELLRKHKKVNEEVRPSTSGVPGPAERRQMELRAILAEKQKQLEALLHMEKTLSDDQKIKTDSRGASVINQSYNSEIEEPDSRSEQILVEVQSAREHDSFRDNGENVFTERALNSLPTHLASSAYCSDSDSASRIKSNQRVRLRRRQPQERNVDDNDISQTNVRHEPRVETPSANIIPPMSHNGENINNVPFNHIPPPSWSNAKTNQDIRSNQFTQNSHSQTMDRLLGTPPMSFPPSMPFMMPYGMVSSCGCGCGLWGTWCWQQVVMQQREIHQLREQLNHLEERWRQVTASHTLNNQVPPGNRANNYWDNFRSYSRQNLLSANSKTNADGHLSVGPAHNPHPLVERSHNTLHPSVSTPSSTNTPKRNTNALGATNQSMNNTDEPSRHGRLNISYERSLSFSSAPDVLNVNQNIDADIPAPPPHSRNVDENVNSLNVTNVNLNRHDAPSNPFRNLNISNSIPEIVQSLSNNYNSATNSFNSKKKSSSKLPAKNSANRRNCALDYSQTSNINIASTSEAPNPNLASTSRETRDKDTSKLFDLLRENVYSEVTALIGVNESHPDFLIQLFRELQLISSDSLRQKVLQSIRNVLSQYSAIVENHNNEFTGGDESRLDSVTTTTSEPAPPTFAEPNSATGQNICSSTQADNNIVRFLLANNDDICTPDFLETLATQIVNMDGRQSHCSKIRLMDFLLKYEGARLRDVNTDIIENLPALVSLGDDCGDNQDGMQDVAGALECRPGDSQVHQMNACPYEMWRFANNSEDMHNQSLSNSQEGKVDLINCAEMNNGDLAEADQTCPNDMADLTGGARDDPPSAGDSLPDVVDTEEATPTEAEAEWLGLDRVPTRLHMEDSSENQKD